LHIVTWHITNCKTLPVGEASISKSFCKLTVPTPVLEEAELANTIARDVSTSGTGGGAGTLCKPVVAIKNEKKCLTIYTYIICWMLQVRLLYGLHQWLNSFARPGFYRDTLELTQKIWTQKLLCPVFYVFKYPNHCLLIC
jgi:hypothetical protein